MIAAGLQVAIDVCVIDAVELQCMLKIYSFQLDPEVTPQNIGTGYLSFLPSANYEARKSIIARPPASGVGLNLSLETQSGELHFST